MKKKIISLLLTAAMITSLSGCASKPAAAPETPAATAAAPEAPAADAPVVETPAEDVPVVDAPVVETPAEEAPASCPEAVFLPFRPVDGSLHSASVPVLLPLFVRGV